MLLAMFNTGIRDGKKNKYKQFKYIKKMKKMMILTAAAVVLGVTATSCGSTKSVPLSECEKLAAKSPLTRAAGTGQFFDESTAKNLAELDASAQFARNIERHVRTATANDAQGYQGYSGGEHLGNAERDQYTKVNDENFVAADEIIANTVVIHKEKFKLKNGEWKVWVCLEYQKGEAAMKAKIEEAVRKRRLSEEEKLEIDYKAEQFQNRVDKELEKRKSK
ncbi:hypothetical protein AGMMS4957_09490 [Bacteroidia bacterium]|nr:hypothetical protein AGMMS4957_09490 [Bacteroidia bacterium]